MKRFDLKAALAGAPVVTRNQRKVAWIAHDAGASKRYCVLARPEGEDCVRVYMENGTFWGEECSRNDLFMAPTKRTVWVLLYLYRDAYGESALAFESERAARDWVAGDRDRRILSLFPHEYEEPSDV